MDLCLVRLVLKHFDLRLLDHRRAELKTWEKAFEKYEVPAKESTNQQFLKCGHVASHLS